MGGDEVDYGISYDEMTPEQRTTFLAVLHEGEPKTLDAWLAYAAALSPVEYDRQREIIARRLGIRVSTLDEQIKKQRAHKSESAASGEGDTILLSDPEPWPDPVRIGEILSKIRSTIQRYVIIADAAAVAVTLWIIHSYTHEATSVSPILAITSPEKRCGKTTLLELLTALVSRALPTANVTAATIFRGIQAFHPTLLIDEADTFINRDANELRGILNSGHRRSTAIVLRTVGDTYEVKQFSTWCPKAIAAIGKLPDTLQDRSIVIQMRRRTADEKVDGLRLDRIAAELQPIRRQVSRWCEDHRCSLMMADPNMPPGVDDRAGDNWRPLFAIADAGGEDWSKIARHAAVELCSNRDEDDESARTMLLCDIKNIYEHRNVNRLASVDLVTSLTELEERPWPEWKNGKPITPRQLAKMLKPFGISPKAFRLASGLVKGYDIDQFYDAFLRYLPSQSVTRLQSNTDTGFSDFRIGNIDSNVTDLKTDKAHEINNVTDVTDEKEGRAVRL